MRHIVLIFAIVTTLFSLDSYEIEQSREVVNVFKNKKVIFTIKDEDGTILEAKLSQNKKNLYIAYYNDCLYSINLKKQTKKRITCDYTEIWGLKELDNKLYLWGLDDEKKTKGFLKVIDLNSKKLKLLKNFDI